MSFVSAIDQEIEAIEASIKREPDPRLVKLHELRRLRSLYSGAATPATFTAKHEFSDVPMPARSGGRRASPEREKAIEMARNYLKGSVGPVKTVTILDRIVQQGAVVGGTSPVSNLSAMMYHHPAFVSHGRKGWTLKEQQAENEKPADDVPGEDASAGLSDPSNEHSRDAMQGGGT
jgi:hypothetical protein